MMNYDTVIRFALIFGILLTLVGILGLFIHECGHGVTAELLGGEFKALFVFPGIQVWPQLGLPYPGEWHGYVGLAHFAYGPEWDSDSWRVGAVHIMGSGSTLLIAVLALGALSYFHPKGWLRLLLLSSSFMFIDLLFYTFLPLMGLPHWIFFGGRSPEPLEGALQLGIPQWLFLVFVILISTLMICGVIKHIRTQRVT